MPETMTSSSAENVTLTTNPPAAHQEPEKKVDLVTRVSQFKKEETPQSAEVKEPEFNFQDIEKIQDPAAKEQALRAYKSFQSGFNKKFQEIADIRKSLEAQKNQSWTPERIQELLKDKNFVQASQELLKSQAPSTWEGTQQEWSTLSDMEKAKFQKMEDEISQLKQQNYLSQVKEQDMGLQKKYANYNPQAIDILTADLLAGKVQATREHLHKVLDYDEAVKRAYDLGKNDGLSERQERVTSSSMQNGVAMSPAKEIPQPDKSDNTVSYFRKLVMNRLAEKK